MDKDQLMRFAQRNAHPEPVLHSPAHERIELGSAFYDVGGLTVGQHVHLTLFAACLATGARIETAADHVRKALPTVLQELAKSNTYVEQSFDPPAPTQKLEICKHLGGLNYTPNGTTTHTCNTCGIPLSLEEVRQVNEHHRIKGFPYG